jgi:hypothetical protein
MKDTTYVVVKGVDRNNRPVAEDWIGTDASGTMKLVARLRAPGIASVLLEPVPGKPAITLDEIRWMLCEDYCQAEDLWETHDAFEMRFHAASDFYKTELIQSEIYRPFKQVVDADKVSGAILQYWIENSDVQRALEQQTTYEMWDYRMRYEDAETSSALEIPLIQALVASGVDPVMAKILGLYHDVPGEDIEHYTGRDIKVEADFPFFAIENLLQVDAMLAMLLGNQSQSSFLDAKHTLPGTMLCGLVLAPDVTRKPAPIAPSGFTTAIVVNDIPSQTNMDEVNLLVAAKIEAPVDLSETRPYLVPVGYAVERSHSGRPFVNVITAEETAFDVLDEIGIIPPVYFPRKEQGKWESPLKLSDDLALPAEPGQTVQYRLKAYDIFGRPSDPVTGKVETIAVPCHAPPAPANLSSRIVNYGDDLFMEITFSLDSARRKLEAEWQTLEVFVHRLETDNTELPKEVSWSGSRPGRKVEVPVAPDHQLVVPSLSQSCVSLSGTAGNLQRETADEGFCSVELPLGTPVLETMNPPSMPFEETGFRTYQLRVKVGDQSAMEPDIYRWCARIRIKGQRPDGTTSYSDEVCIASERLITPPVPVPTRPTPDVIPESTHPDPLGNSYFNLDLQEFNLTNGDMVNVYAITLERLANPIDAFVDGSLLIDKAALLTLAKASKHRFELLTQQPVEFKTSSVRFYPVKVPGDLRQYHVIGVVGANEYFQEQDWTTASFVVFKTPEPVPIPILRFIEADTFVESGVPKVNLQYTADFSGVVLTNPPKVQILRRDFSTGARASVYRNDVVGELDTGGATYRFTYVDDTMQEWHRYGYEAYLLVYSDRHGQYIKSDNPALCEVQAPWGGTGAPLDNADRLQSAVNGNGELQVVVEFDTGEFDFSLTGIRADNTAARIQGALNKGKVVGLPADAYTFEILPGGARYRLTFRNPAGEQGKYTFRISFAQQATWSRKETKAELGLSQKGVPSLTTKTTIGGKMP